MRNIKTEEKTSSLMFFWGGLESSRSQDQGHSKSTDFPLKSFISWVWGSIIISKFERKIFRNFAFFLKTISVQNSNILSFFFWLGRLLWVPRTKICPQKNSNCGLLNQINNLLVALRHKVQRVRPRQKVSFGNIFEIVSKGKLTMWLFLFYTWTGPLKLSFRNSISKAESGRIHSWDD